MTRTLVKLSRGVLFTGGMLTGLIFLFLVPKDLTGRLQLAYAQTFRWPLTAGRGLTLAARTAPQVTNGSGADYETLLEAHQRLENTVANLQSRLEEANRRIEQLAKLRMNSAWENMAFLPAGVITAADQAASELIINRGQNSGVAVGQYVMSLSEQCIVGTVSQVSPRGAKVRLITDPDSRLPVGVGGRSVRGLLVGRGENVARVGQVPDGHGIRPGDAVYAEKAPGLLDVPVVVGKVAQCRRDPDNPVVWEVTVRPACDVIGLTEVAVIVSAVEPQ